MKSLALIAVFVLSFVVSAQTAPPVVEKSSNSLSKATWYYENGSVKEIGYFKNGVKHGTWVAYTESGNKISEANYNNGLKDGNWMFWHSNGTLHYQVVYKMGKKILYTEWDTNGQLVAGMQNK